MSENYAECDAVNGCVVSLEYLTPMNHSTKKIVIVTAGFSDNAQNATKRHFLANIVKYSGKHSQNIPINARGIRRSKVCIVNVRYSGVKAYQNAICRYENAEKMIAEKDLYYLLSRQILLQLYLKMHTFGSTFGSTLERVRIDIIAKSAGAGVAVMLIEAAHRYCFSIDNVFLQAISPMIFQENEITSEKKISIGLAWARVDKRIPFENFETMKDQLRRAGMFVVGHVFNSPYVHNNSITDDESHAFIPSYTDYAFRVILGMI